MARFRRGEIQVLVATTVIEVGRGRARGDGHGGARTPIASGSPSSTSCGVGWAARTGRRGATCCRRPSTPDAATRLEALERSNDGFELAEVDLELRGEGTILGTRQKGRSDLKLASLRRGDRPLVEAARRVAESLLADDPLARGAPRARRRGPACSSGEAEAAFLLKS